MARTRQQWEAEIAAVLPSASSSAVAVWKLFRDLVVTIALISEAIYEAIKSDVDNSLATKQPGGLYWYRQMALDFQNGDSLQVVNGVVSYPVVNPANKIIKQVSVKEMDGEVVAIKVCKEVAGVTQALSSGELTSFINYIKARKYPGTKTMIHSSAADVIYYEIGGIYDPAYDHAVLQAALLDTANAFKANFSFDGMLSYSELLAALKAVPGMRHVTLVLNLMLSDSSVINGFDGYMELPAGYFVYEPSSVVNTLTPAE